MLSTGLSGPYKLDSETVDKRVNSSIGAYALGYVNSDGAFVVERVGRSDDDLNDRLKDKDYLDKYESFKFGYFSNVKDAFEKECKLYHDFKPPDNKIHPDRPKGKDYECPVCNMFDRY